MLNKWECHEPGCKSTAVGAGSGFGLRAVGWWYESGEPMFCPLHRPDKTTKRVADVPCDTAGPCRACKGELEADKLQYLIAQYHELLGDDMAYFKKCAERWDDPQDGGR